MSADNQLDQSSASRAGGQNIPSPARQHDVVPEAAAVRAPRTEPELGNGPAAPVRGLPG